MATLKIGNGLDMMRTEIFNPVLQNLSSAPSTPPEGMFYYDTTLDKMGVYQGSAWVYLATAGTGTVTSVSVVSANGFAGSVATDTTTPAITLSTTITGLLKGNGTAISAAVAGTDYVIPGGSVATLTTARNIFGYSFNGSADLTGIIASTYGGTGNGFTKFTGPTTSEKTFTLPNASATILTDNAVVTGAQGGTGIANTGKTITIGGNFSTVGAFTTALTVTANTAVTLPTTGTLATLAGSEALTNKNLNSGTNTFPTFNQNTTGSAATLTTSRNIYGNAFNGSADVTGIIAGTYGGTGVNNSTRTMTYAGNIAFAGAFTQTFTATANTSVTLPTSGTLATLAGTETFTNKTFDANGTGNSITNLETADFAANVVDTDVNLTAASNTRLASQLAIKTYIDNKVVGLLDYKGSIDASANPNFPSALKGDTYVISVAGKIGGASGTDVQVGDYIIANADNAGGTLASVGTSWDILQSNQVAASTTVAGYVELATQAETEAKTDTVRAVTPASLVNFTKKYTATIGDNSTTALVVTHNLGTQDITWSIRDATTNAFVLTDVTATSTNTATFTFAVAPATNAYKVVIVG